MGGVGGCVGVVVCLLEVGCERQAQEQLGQERQTHRLTAAGAARLLCVCVRAALTRDLPDLFCLNS